MALPVEAARTARQFDDVEVVEMTRAEYLAARKRALRSVGLTYRQLAGQARHGEFSSPRARKVWLVYGEAPS